jgi:hypothetical protein
VDVGDPGLPEGDEGEGRAVAGNCHIGPRREAGEPVRRGQVHVKADRPDGHRVAPGAPLEDPERKRREERGREPHHERLSRDARARGDLARPGHGRRRWPSAMERLGELSRGREPVAGELLERAGQGGDDERRHGPAQIRDRPRDVGDDFHDDLLRRVAQVRRLAGQHLVQHARQRVDVAAPGDGAVRGRLLGAHVVWRA